jgi:bifunctional DNA-binding transcriptional regulator/antitoxin component of YhaV-PrlF toxin-antitoxin module
MTYTTTVTQKGLAIIQVQIRKLPGIKTNTKIVFEIKNNKEVPIKPVVDFFSLKGSIKTNKSFDIEAMEKVTSSRE